LVVFISFSFGWVRYVLLDAELNAVPSGRPVRRDARAVGHFVLYPSDQVVDGVKVAAQ